ncbi:ankyrin repeat domain-containing protein [Clostridium intestinale]|uniref:MHCI C-terminus family protein n=2 Tax=Clostridium intestinale TaxID=36845 RepID=U2N4W8_9CLOT|nr:ankyrin repeat domain-containing protein [Clostridium intestinale]ERK30532.1 MHCI C-terminus family protein [Clostridium intestinale URNW]QLY78458.1 ankyrin repeat domain-containing protein [Clostridium intestinale]
MGASAAIIIIIAMFFIGLFITIPSLIGLITYKLHNKKKGKKPKLIVRIILIITLISGLTVFSLPILFVGTLVYDQYEHAQYKKTLVGAADREDLIKVKELLDSGTDPDQNDGSNYTALTYACTSGNYEIAKLLIEHGCTIDVEFKGYSDGKQKGYTPLMYAVTEQQGYDLVNLLISNQADINHKASSDGYTPLIRAVNCEQPEIVNLLIKNGADVNASDNKGITVLQHACDNSPNYANYSNIKTLLEAGALVNTDTTTLESLTTLVKKSTINISNPNDDYTDKIISILSEHSNK